VTSATGVGDLPPFATRRLRIARLGDDDAAALVAITDDPAITRAIHFLPTPFTRADAAALIRGTIHGVERFYGVWADDAQLIGVVGAGLRGGDIEIGYWFGTRFHGKGYAAEAVGAVIDGLRRVFPARRIIAECRRDNIASWRLLARLGFTATGTPGDRPQRELLVLSP
jgi:RimJ/RimL family protein N-acetyltransferase